MSDIKNHLKRYAHWIPLAIQVAAAWMLGLIYGLTGWTISDYIHDVYTIAMLSLMTSFASFVYAMNKEVERG